MGIFRSDSSDNLPIIASGVSPARAVAYNTPRQLTAAATQIKINDKAEFEQFKSRRSSGSSIWQGEAWEYYDAIGEIKYAFNLVASVISRIRIFPAVVEDSSQTPVPATQSTIMDARLSSAADRALERLNSAFGGQPGLLRDAALNLSVCGECYLVQIPERIGSGIPESWDIRSIDEIKTDPKGGYSVIGRREMATSNNSGPYNKLPSNAFIGRVWRSHPRYCADSQTEIFSQRGWLSYSELTTDDVVLTLNHETGLSEWQPVQRVNVFHVEDEPMLAIDTKYHSSLTTMDHKWPTLQTKRFRGQKNSQQRVWQLSSELNTNSAIITAAPSHSLPSEKLWSDAFVELAAWFWTEGTYDGWRSHEEARINDTLVDAAGWKTSVLNARVRSGMSLRDLGSELLSRTGREHSDPQQYGADIQRKGLSKPEHRTALCEILDITSDEVEVFYEKAPLSRQIVISQSHKVNPTYVARIRAALTALYGPAADGLLRHTATSTPAWREYRDSNPEKGMTYFSLNTEASKPFVEITTGNKIISTEFIDQLTEDQLKIFIDTSIDADGTRAKNQTRILTQALEERLVPFEHAAILLGIPYRKWVDAERGKFGITLRRYDTYQLHADKMSTKTYTGAVWCPTTENRSWYARRNGTAYFTGNSDEADSSLRGLLDLCSELLLLNRTFRATARSRLNAGALYLPDGLSVAAQGDVDIYDDDSDLDPALVAAEAEDDFEEQLIDAMTTPIRDEESASAVVPLIIRGPAELGDKIKQFKFERSFDPALAQRADRVLERILQGLDVPKDIVTGLANVKYSNALQIDETLYKTHIEPLMLLIVDALTVVYLRPYLIASGFSPEEVNRIVVWYDPSAVSTRNDRATDADSGYDRYAVSLDTWRRAHGFSDADAPTANELAIRMMMERGAFTPELTEAMLSALAPEVMDSVRTAQQASSVGAIPPEVQQALQGAEVVEPETETPTEETPAPPQEEQPNA